ncbi:phosphoribosylformimino-5-aminoimidazole carboxamide ribotide isomerase [Thiovulum sp. ES]|nr:phosphoribosylformimino-5-aminoimidazole carboxamide ribotide isomerase [Thiovulum sp. ES]
MELIPAIDLKDGQAVRLTKGLMDSAKIYSSEPWAVAKEFEQMGAKWLHIVDLNGAFAGEPKNLSQIEQIRKNTSLKIELGGGIRDEKIIKFYSDLGIERIILGSIAKSNPDFAIKMSEIYKIAIGIDAINGMVAVDGWADVSEVSANDLAQKFKNSRVDAIISTDISKDGTLEGVNLDFTRDIAIHSGIPTIASGGVSGISDLENIANAGNIAGAIIGKAFYEGRLDLREAFKKFGR